MHIKGRRTVSVMSLLRPEAKEYLRMTIWQRCHVWKPDTSYMSYKYHDLQHSFDTSHTNICLTDKMVQTVWWHLNWSDLQHSAVKPLINYRLQWRLQNAGCGDLNMSVYEIQQEKESDQKHAVADIHIHIQTILTCVTLHWSQPTTCRRDII